MSSNPLPVEHSGYGESRPRAAFPRERVLLAAIGAAILFYFVVRGWLGASLVLLGLFSAVSCFIHLSETRQSLRDPGVRWLALAFMAPVAAAILVNAGHQQLVPRSFDAALRFLLAFAIFLELRRQRLDAAPMAGLAFPVAIALCAGLVMLVPQSAQYYWAGRFATYFIDPILLCQHVLIAAFICLFLIDPHSREPRWTSVLKVAGIGLALLVALGTQSRGGWIMVPLLATIWLMRGRRVTALQVCACVGGVLLACAAAYWGSAVIRMRIDQVGTDLAQYASGANLDTSVGLRLSLFRTALILSAEHPLLGWGFGALPDIRTVPSVAPFYSPALQSYFSGAGVHNEFLQAMMRMGVVGLASRVLIYVVPLCIFIAAARSVTPRVRQNGYLGLVVVVGYVTAGLTSEVTNLIYAASFYALLVAVFAAGALPRRPA
jgi:O-antigen ligase